MVKSDGGSCRCTWAFVPVVVRFENDGGLVKVLFHLFEHDLELDQLVGCEFGRLRAAVVMCEVDRVVVKLCQAKVLQDLAHDDVCQLAPVFAALVQLFTDRFVLGLAGHVVTRDGGQPGGSSCRSGFPEFA